MKTARLIASAALLTTTAFAAQSALAYQAGDIYGRLSFEKQDSQHSSIRADPWTLGVSNATGFGYAAGYLFHDKFGVELNGSQTMKHEMSHIGVFKRTPINLMLNYYPLGGIAHTRINPYLGLGVNYSDFSTESSFDGHIDDTWGVAVQAGMELSLTDNILVGAYARYAEADADLKVDGYHKGKLELDPVSVGAGLTYRF
ncbi:OmpW/AlkL family protein [Halomonas binhaiensis]|uniref:OmpW family protein n=1 Tax=Halomonas binhaiensis TaxID=2562282 RepID=A0A5C1NHG3_9GAMM|nr:OmpW family outer membrane protein [Halomonas binhaiensis]QEM82360.1 OmpW family protein [Halomonas binhaiensis]